MQTRSRAPLWILIALGVLAACTSVQVSTDYDRDTDFSALRTYAWMQPRPTGDPRIDNDLLHQRVRRAVDEHMAAKGFAKAQTAPDFQIIEHFVIERQVDVDTYVQSYGYRRVPVVTETHVREYDMGTVIFDIVDTRSKRLLWRGSGQARVHEEASPEERAERVRVVVDKVLANFPPETGS